MSEHVLHTTPEHAERPFFLGVDIGGTGIKIGLVDNRGHTLGFTHVPTLPREGFAGAMQRTADACAALLAPRQVARGEVAAIGVGIPGMIKVKEGLLIAAHNLPGWKNVNVRDTLAQLTGLPVLLANDANAASYGEFWIGAGKVQASLVMITLGTGVGGGIVIDGHVIAGAHDFGAEVGHMIIDADDDARLCGCGQRGHLEAYCSATAVKKRMLEELDVGRASSLLAKREGGIDLSPLHVAEEAEAGDEFARNLVLETARFLGIGVTNLLHVVDPEILLIGGAMTFGGEDSPLGREFLERVRTEVHRRAMPIQAQHSVIEFAHLGGDAGYIGAAGMARRAREMGAIG